MTDAVLPLAEFPLYTRREAAADRVLHYLGVPAALVAVCWLVLRLLPHGSARQLVAAGLYGFGLVCMLGASAGYNLAAPGRRKAILRRLDHAMIFVMIAGSYTPFALCALPDRFGLPLLVAAWAVAGIGTALKLLAGRGRDGIFVGLYLAHGWMILAVLHPLAHAVPPGVVGPLVAGGVVYSLGALIHARSRWPFQNAVWHALVLVAAGLHLCAISRVLGAVTV